MKFGWGKSSVIVLGLVVASGSWGARLIAAGPFEKDAKVRLARDAPLLFQDKPLRNGRAGELFTVLKHDPAAHKVFLLATGGDGKPVALNVAEDCVERLFPPWLTPAEVRLLTAASDPYFLDGKLVEPAADRSVVLAEFARSADPAEKTIASNLVALDELEAEVKANPEKQAAAIRRFGGKWRDFVGGTIKDELRSKIFGEPADKDVVAETEEMTRDLQAAKGNQLRLECLCAELPNAARRGIEALGESKQKAPANAKIPLAVSAFVDKGIVWLKLENRGARTLHESSIIGRRLQDTERVNAMHQDRKIAGGLMQLFGFSQEATVTNDINSRLAIHTYEMEQGGFAFLPRLAPRSQVTLAVSSMQALAFTRSIETSLWCDEGAALNLQASNLAALLKPPPQGPQPRGNSSGGSRPPASGPGLLPPNRGGLQPSTGLQPGGNPRR
ncbi:MAG: hypothetical protein QOE70_809 [Chthoniobacter sp.]|jgi:hypothetical protein|nr:hypothetical protein [Chthoniobacter sp.]